MSDLPAPDPSASRTTAARMTEADWEEAMALFLDGRGAGKTLAAPAHKHRWWRPLGGTPQLA